MQSQNQMVWQCLSLCQPSQHKREGPPWRTVVRPSQAENSCALTWSGNQHLPDHADTRGEQCAKCKLAKLITIRTNHQIRRRRGKWNSMPTLSWLTWLDYCCHGFFGSHQSPCSLFHICEVLHTDGALIWMYRDKHPSKSKAQNWEKCSVLGPFYVSVMLDYMKHNFA